MIALRVTLLIALVTPSTHAQVTGQQPPIAAKDLKHWSFQPLRRTKPPAVDGVVSPIDRFVAARTAASGIRPLPEADRHTLIRRVTFDLTGLPPTPGQVDRFVADRSGEAYGKLVDQLLASPAYGERWAQLWLDLARFAETDGFEHDKIRREAWKFRDWVIDALNKDLPYDTFVQMQIAGDELSPGDVNAAVATGFLMAGPDMPDINDQAERRHTKLNEMTSTVGTVFLGLTLGCAQCHDHKYDPISQADFYSLRAVFANTVFPRRDKLLATVVREPGPVAPTEHVMLRGHFQRRGPSVKPAFLRVVNQNPAVAFRPASLEKSSGRRLAFAKWLTRPDHPLATRVIVNWLWQFHFGRGLVDTPNDFGTQGRPPSHPQLLDWLATELPRRGFRLKAMHRLMVTSATYRRASVSRSNESAWRAGRTRDPKNILLWRANHVRLQGEVIRDAMLTVSGRLSARRGGPGVRPPLPAEVTGTLLRGQWKVTLDKADHDRRSIYLFARRNLVFPFFGVFDRPDANASCARRARSTTAPQSLTLLNSKFSLDCARYLAGIALADSSDRRAQLTTIYRRALARHPTQSEFESGVAFLEAQTAMLREATTTKARAMAWPLPMRVRSDRESAVALVDFCLAVFNLNEFVYID